MIHALVILAADTAPAAAPAFLQTIFLQYVVPVLGTALLSLLSWASAKFVAWLGHKEQGASADSAQRKAIHALSVATEGIGAVVAGGISKLSADVRDALANDGKIDDAERKTIEADALAMVKQLPEPILNGLSTVFGGGTQAVITGLVNKEISAQLAKAADGIGPADVAVVPTSATITGSTSP